MDAHSLELARFRAILSERLPSRRRAVCIGRGAPSLAAWLASRGHDVAVAEPPTGGTGAATALRSSFGAMHTQASHLPLKDSCVDAVVLAGPLHDLLNTNERAAALREAARVLRPGGLFAALALARSSELNAAMLPGWPEGREATQRSPVTSRPVFAYKPRDLDAELREAGLVEREILAADGFFSFLDDIEGRMRDLNARAALLGVLRRVEKDPAMVGISSHLVAIGRRADHTTNLRAGEPTEWSAPTSKENRAVIPRVDPAMAAYYGSGVEQGRLESRNLLEFERTKILLAERLPRCGRVLDVGGGPGTYASWLAGNGYEVALLDPIPLHAEQADLLSRRGAPFGVQLGDARALPCRERSVDGVVMMGPLFHLVDPADRKTALREAWRVLRPGGVLVASAMGRMFLLCHSIVAGAIRQRSERERVLSVAATGLRLNPPLPFPAFAHRPGELAAEMREAGFSSVEIVAIEGHFHLVGDVVERLRDERSRAALLGLLHRFESDPGLVGISGHIMGIAVRGEHHQSSPTSKGTSPSTS